MSLTHSFTDEQIAEFCGVLQEGISHFFDVSDYQEISYFVMLRPTAYKDKGVLKDGIHIECPDFSLTNDKWNVLRRWILKNGAIRRIFGQTGYLNEDHDVFDQAMGRNQGWMLYGASKPQIPAYKLSWVKKYTPETDAWETVESHLTPRQLLEHLSIRYNVVQGCGDVKAERKDDFDDFLNPPGLQGGAPAAVQPAEPHSQNVQALLSLVPHPEDERVLIGRLVRDCLSVERAEAFLTWRCVGLCLHNIEPSDEMFDLWMDFSKKSPKSAGNNVSQLRKDWFQGMRKDGDGPKLTIRSLHLWARQDNKAKYEEIMNEDVLEYIIRKLDGTHYHISLLMQKMFGNNYVASIGNKVTEWYTYDELLNMWKHLNQGVDLKRKIFIDVAGKVDAACDRVKTRLKDASDEDTEALLAAKLKSLHKIQSCLYTAGFVDSVMKMASALFAEEDFMSKLNMNPYLFGCANGILELRQKETPTSKERVFFRQGKAEDFVSFLGGKSISDSWDAISYKPYDPNDPNMPEIMDFFKKVFPRDDLREYVFRLLASCLEGTNKEQCFYIFHGSGSNGKSKIIDLMTMIFGDYQTSIQTTVLTRKRPESGAANPDIIVTKCKRFIHMGEPDRNEQLNTSRMKQFTGEDLVEARGLFQDQEKFKIMGKMALCCNDLPPINSMDDGTWRRVRVIPFESKFRYADHKDWKAGLKYLFLRDDGLKDKMLRWRESLFSYLVHIYETQYLTNGLNPEPPIVLQVSDKYKDSYDVFAKFMSERVRQEDGNRVEFKDMKRIFKAWRQEASVKANLTDAELWGRCLESSNIGKFNERKQILIHIRVFSTDEEVEEYDKEHDEASGAE
jgi:P4 family phage/plasmid primase-like protien